MTFGAVYLGMVLPVLFSGVTTRSAIAKQDQPAVVVCVDPEYYREQAAHFRQLAGAISRDKTSVTSTRAFKPRTGVTSLAISRRAMPVWPQFRVRDTVGWREQFTRKAGETSRNATLPRTLAIQGYDCKRFS